MKKIWFVAMCTTLVLVGSLGTIAKPSLATTSDIKEEKCLIYGWIYDEKYRVAASNVEVTVYDRETNDEVAKNWTNDIGFYQVQVNKPGRYEIRVHQKICDDRWILLGCRIVNVSSSDKVKIVNITWIHKYPVIRLSVRNLPQGEHAKVVWAIREKGCILPIPPWLLALLYKENRRLPSLENLTGKLIERFFYPIKYADIPVYYHEDGTRYYIINGIGYCTIVAMTSSKFASKEVYIEQWGQEVNVTLDLSNPPLWYKLL